MAPLPNVVLKRLPLFPATTTVVNSEHGLALTIAGINLHELAERFGTPLYLYDQATMDAAVAEYKQALDRFYPGESGITYAGKAFLNLAAAQWARRSNLVVDCTGAGEIHVATVAGVPPAQLLVHGVNKSDDDLLAAVDNAGIVVVDNLEELRRLDKLAGSKRLPDLWLRVRPGIAVSTHTYRQTGQHDSKFGMSHREVANAVAYCGQRQMPLTGLHFHQGSHFHDPSPIGPALDTVLDLIVLLVREFDWRPDVVCCGGGWGVAYHESELPHPPIEQYVSFVARHLAIGCHRRGLPLPRLQVEPGRSLVARAGVALYRIGALKTTAGRQWLLLDGGMADNPRPALYGARYSALPVRRVDRMADHILTLAGPYCESGDILIEELVLPRLASGEIVAIPVSGAYQLTMGNNYNGARKPAVVWLNNDGVALVQRRETLDDLIARDRPLPG